MGWVDPLQKYPKTKQLLQQPQRPHKKNMTFVRCLLLVFPVLGLDAMSLGLLYLVLCRQVNARDVLDIEVGPCNLGNHFPPQIPGSVLPMNIQRGRPEPFGPRHIDISSIVHQSLGSCCTDEARLVQVSQVLAQSHLWGNPLSNECRPASFGLHCLWPPDFSTTCKSWNSEARVLSPIALGRYMLHPFHACQALGLINLCPPLHPLNRNRGWWGDQSSMPNKSDAWVNIHCHINHVFCDGGVFFVVEQVR